MSRRAAFVEFTVRECQDAIQIGLVQIRKRLIDAANELLDNGAVPAVRAASRVIVENFPAVARVADVSDGEQIEDLSDIPDADIDRMKAIRDAARAQPAVAIRYARVSKADGSQSLDLQRDALSRKLRELVRRVPLARAALCLA